MATKLKNLVITKVALVNEGSCSAAHIKLFKMKEGGKPTMDFQEILKALPEDQRAVVEAEVEKAKQELPEGALSAEDKAKLEADKTAAELAKQKAEEEVVKLKQQNTNPSDDEILKGVDPAVRQLIEKAKNQAAAAEAAIKKMKEEAEEAEALAKAKELLNIGAKTEDLAKSFKQLKNLDANLFDNIYGVMKAANALIADGVGLGEIGGGSDDSKIAKNAAEAAWMEIEKKADEIKKGTNCTKEAAIAKAINENGALYKQYLDNIRK